MKIPEDRTVEAGEENPRPNNRIAELFRTRTMRRLLKLFGILIGTALLLGFITGFILDGMITRRVVEGVNAIPGHHLEIGDVSIDVFTATVALDQVDLDVDRQATAPGVDSLRLHIGHVELSGVSRLKLLFGSGLTVDEVRITSPRIEIYRGAGSDSSGRADSSGRESELETGLLGSLARMLPERISPLRVDRVEIIGGTLFRSRRYESGVVLDSVPSFSITVDDLNSEPDASTPDRAGYYSQIAAGARDVVLHVAHGTYAITADSLSISSADSLLALREFRVLPALPSDRFFDSASGRLSRFSLYLPHGEMKGLRFQRLFYGELNAIDFALDNPTFDVLADKRRERNPDLSRPRLPNEYLATVAPVVRIDSIHLRHGSVVYRELHPDVPDTASVNFTEVSVDIADIDTETPSAGRGTYISGTARLFDAARLHLMMNLPLASDEPIYYEGWLEPMDAALFNRFLVPAERARITSGNIDRVTFTVNIEGGRAHGTITPLYHDLAVELIEIPGAGEKGIVGWMKRTAARGFHVESANPFPGDTVRVGHIDYGRGVEQAFFGYIWSALRNGLREVVGF